MKNNIIGGVISNNSISFLWDELHNMIDLDFEEYARNNPRADLDEYFNDAPTYIIGFNYNDDTGFYDIDNDAEFSAIIGEIYTQIVHSKYVTKCGMCSPCYPMQGDLHSVGDNITYCLPVNMFEICPYDVLEVAEL